MGQPNLSLTCSNADTIAKLQSIHNQTHTLGEDNQQTTRRKINPLKYISPIKFATEEHPTANFDSGFFHTKKNIDSHDKQNHQDEIENQKNQKKNNHNNNNNIQQIQDIDRMLEQQMLMLDSNNKNSNNITTEKSNIIDRDLQQQHLVRVKWDKFIKMKTRTFQQDYKIVSEIGRGGFGCVYKVIMRNGKIQRAAKKINKKNLKQQQHEHLLEQMAIMMSLDHPNITKLYQVYDQKSHYIMVLQLCQGGELFDKIVSRSIKEGQARIITDQLLNAVNYIHGRGIVHRDIKPENILFQKTTKLVKIIDFGISKKIRPGEYLNARVGTPYYIAPQVLYKKYNQKCDMWSLGIMLYMIIFNYPPFKGDNAIKIMQNVAKDQIDFKLNHKTKFSTLCMDFLVCLLQKDPSKRLSAKQALQHPWLREKKRLSDSGCKDREKVLQRISNFHFKDKLQAVVHTYIVSQLLTSQERIELLDVFRELDSNNNGIIDREQIKTALLTKNFSKLDQKKIRKIFNYIDTNCSGHIDYTQFLVAAIDFPKKITQKHFQQAFAYFDIDNSGEITFQQVVKFLQNQIESRQQIKKMFMTVDKNGDGVISKTQFVQLLINHQKGQLQCSMTDIEVNQ